MPDYAPDLSGILLRLERVEKQNRKFKQAGLTFLLLTSAILLIGQVQPSRTVVAEKFVLRDAGGKVRGELGMLCNGPCLRFFDADGTLRSAISSWSVSIESADVEVAKDRSDLSKGFAYVKGPSVQLSQSGLSVLDKRQSRVLIDLDWIQGADSPSLTLFAREERNGKRSRTELSTSADGPSLALSDAQEFSAVLGSTSLETVRTGETHKRSVASIVLFGKDGKVLWSAP